jgi:hypothetical protein
MSKPNVTTHSIGSFDPFFRLQARRLRRLRQRCGRATRGADALMFFRLLILGCLLFAPGSYAQLGLPAGIAQLYPQTGAAGPALIAHTLWSSVSTATSSPLNTTGANWIGVSVASGPGASFTVTDSNSNTCAKVPDANAPYVQSYTQTVVYQCVNPTVGSGHTFTITGTGLQFCAAVEAFSGVATSSPYDQGNGNTSGGNTSQTGAITPGVNNEVIVTSVSTYAPGVVTPYTIDSGFTITDQADAVASTTFGCGMAYLVQSTAGTINPTWTLNSSVFVSPSEIASFKP